MKALLILTVVMLGMLLQSCSLFKKDTCYNSNRYYKEGRFTRKGLRKSLRKDYRYHQVRPNNPVLNLFRRKP